MKPLSPTVKAQLDRRELAECVAAVADSTTQAWDAARRAQERLHGYLAAIATDDDASQFLRAMRNALVDTELAFKRMGTATTLALEVIDTLQDKKR